MGISTPFSRESIADWTVTPVPSSASKADERAMINLVVLPGDSLDKGFAAARTYLARGKAVRLIGHGATLPPNWPAWVRETGALLLTELGAYHGLGGLESLDRARQDIKNWLDQVFYQCLPGLPGSAVFYGSACARIFEQILNILPILAGIYKSHPRHTVHFLRRHFFGLALDREPADRSGAAQQLALWSAGGIVSVACSIASAALVVREFISSQKTLAQLKTRAVKQAASAAQPRCWVVVTPDWYRNNRAVIQSVALPHIQRGRSLGIAFFGRLRSGQRSEESMKTLSSGTGWPGLGPLREHLDQCALGQLVMPDNIRAVVREIFHGAACSARAFSRALQSCRTLNFETHRFSLTPVIVSLGRLLTLDVLRARIAAAATHQFLQAFPVQGTTFVFSGCSLAPDSAANMLLQRAGATVTELFHGAGGNLWVGASESQVTQRIMWILPDVERHLKMGLPAIAAGLPLALSAAGRPCRPLKKILLLSNYMHRDSPVCGVLPLLPFMRTFLEAALQVEKEFPGRFAFRWRPHPADHRGMVADMLKDFPGVEISANAELEEDLKGADMVISTHSSSAYQALAAGLPVFIHVLPELRHSESIACFSPQRKFFYLDEFVAQLRHFVGAYDADPQRATMPEREVLVRLFGPSGRPAAIDVDKLCLSAAASPPEEAAHPAAVRSAVR